MAGLKVFGAALAMGLITSASSVSAQESEGQWRIAADTDLSALLDCHEEAGRTLVSAHRGGPSPGLPENAIETMDALVTAIPAIMEIDVARSPDGVHYLMHDYTLDRTTTGSGAVSDTPWSEVSQLFLVDEAGWTTPYRVPTLARALDWARGKTVLQIDFKRSADYEEVIDLIRQSGNAQNVVLIAYSIGQASRLNELAPEMLLSVSIDDLGDLFALVEADIPMNRMVAFTGTRLPRPDLYEELDGEDVEVIFGTLGRSPNSIDNVIDRLGMDARYAELGEGGADIIATDRPREAAAALAQAGRLPEAGVCGVSRD
mgnify:FL=1